MAKTTDNSRCGTKGKVKDIRECVKKHGHFKGLYRGRLIFLAQNKDMVNLGARTRMQKRNLEFLAQHGMINVNICTQYTRKHIQCKCAVIPLFRVCTKHLYKDDAENICKNEYVVDNVRTEGGLQIVYFC